MTGIVATEYARILEVIKQKALKAAARLINAARHHLHAADLSAIEQIQALGTGQYQQNHPKQTATMDWIMTVMVMWMF